MGTQESSDMRSLTQDAEGQTKSRVTTKVMAIALCPAQNRASASAATRGSIMACSNLPVPRTAPMPVTNANNSKCAKASGENSLVSKNEDARVNNCPDTEPASNVAMRRIMPKRGAAV